MSNISVVDDPLTGGNYGGIKSDPYTEYVDNLFANIQTPDPKALESNQYYPGANQGVQIGSMANETMGNMPIFGSGRALFPRAVVDNFRQAQRKAEIDYLNKLGEIDVAEYQNIKNLDNPLLMQEFTNKYLGELDTWLEEASTRLGGKSMEAYHALSVDPEYHRMRKKYEDYAATYNQVFAKAIEIIELPGDEVSKDSKQAAQDFIHKFENVDVNNIDTLLKSSDKLKKHVSIFDVSKNITEGVADKIRTTLRENYAAGKDADSFVYDKITVEGYTDKEINKMVEDASNVYTFLQTDEDARNMLTTQLKVRLGAVYKEEFETIKRDMSSTGTYLKNAGVETDQNGDVVLERISTGFTRSSRGEIGKGTNGVVYPKKDKEGKPVTIPTLSGMGVYVKDLNNQVRYVRVPGTFDMIPNAEYDLKSALDGLQSGRYIEGTIDFKKLQTYMPEGTEFSKTSGGRINMKKGPDGEKVPVTIPTGERSRAMDEDVPLEVRDELTGEMVSLRGALQVIVPFDAMKDQVQSVFPFTNRMHNRLPGESVSAPTETPSYDKGEEVSTEDMDPDAPRYEINGYKYSYNELKEAGYTDDKYRQISNIYGLDPEEYWIDGQPIPKAPKERK